MKIKITTKHQNQANWKQTQTSKKEKNKKRSFKLTCNLKGNPQSGPGITSGSNNQGKIKLMKVFGRDNENWRENKESEKKSFGWGRQEKERERERGRN